MVKYDNKSGSCHLQEIPREYLESTYVVLNNYIGNPGKFGLNKTTLVNARISIRYIRMYYPEYCL